MKQSLLLFFLLLFTALPLSAQRLVGRVVDAKSGEAIPFVNVFYDAAKGGRHGADRCRGAFLLPLHKGMRVVVSSVGYESFSTRAVGVTRSSCASSPPTSPSAQLLCRPNARSIRARTIRR